MANLRPKDATRVTTVDAGDSVLLDGTAGVRSIEVPDLLGTPASSTDNAIARFDGTSGALQDSIVTVNDLGHVNINSDSTFIGKNAGAVNNTPAPTDGIYNTFIGSGAGANNTSGYAQLFVGFNSGNANTVGDGNTYIGYASGQAGTTAKWNVAVGTDALFGTIAGQNIVAVGHHVATGVLSADTSVFVGAEANKVGVGAVGTTMVGYRAGYNNNASGLGNSFYGNLTGFTNTSGASDSYFGQEAGFSGTTASNNTFIGYRAGYNNVTGGASVFLGTFAGFYETASSKLFIDNQSRASEADARLKALIYGVFDAATANQRLTINGVFTALGTQTNDSAAAGYIGQYKESVVTSGSAISLTTGTPANVTSISLEAGDWDVSSSVNVIGTGTTSFSAAIGSISQTSATVDTTPLAFGILTYGASPIVPPASTIGVLNMNSGPVRKSFAATTTVYLVGQATFTASTATAWGTIRARRVR